MGKKGLIDNFLRQTLEASGREVGELLGQALECTWKGVRFVRRDDYFDERRRKMLLTTMAVSGDREGVSYLVTGLREAITLGGSLILLPLDEMETRIQKGVFGGEAADAFGEVANIIAGVFTSVAIKAFPQKIHFKKTDVIPLAAAETPVADVDYYLCSSRLTFQDEPLGELDVLLPAALFDLEQDGAAPPSSPAAPAATATPAWPDPTTGGETPPDSTPAPAAAEDAVCSGMEDAPVVLIVAGSADEAAPFLSPLAKEGVPTVCLGVQDNLRGELQGRAVAVAILVMQEVGELGFAATIKIKSAVGVKTPLITAGPAWTRSAVLHAVRYGACDILITPPSAEEVVEKVRAHLPAQPSAA